jgi:Haemolymph juvenile hormone binding protein (JHBP)
MLITFKHNYISASYIKLCNQNDPKLDTCIRKSILSLREKLNTGIPELDVPSLDPLLVPEVIVSQESGINVQATFKNVEISGATNFRLRSVRSDVKSDKFRMKIWFPELIMKGEYDIRGMLLMLPIKGNGVAYGNFCK